MNNNMNDKTIEPIFEKEFKKYLITENQILKEYPSVSSVTKLINEYGIKMWRRKVGITKANDICKKATERGTQVHAIIEKYLKSEKKIEPSPDDDNYIMFINMKPYLDRITDVRLIEDFVISDTHKIAGTVDCIGKYDDELSVIDFKTSTKKKQKNISYLVQCAAYAECFNEMKNSQINKLVIITGIDDEKVKCSVDIGMRQLYLDKLIKYRKMFRERYNF